MQTILIGIGCVWLLMAIAFLFAICRAAHRPIPSPEADDIPSTNPPLTVPADPISPALDEFGDYKKAPRTVVVPTSTSQPSLDQPALREAPHGAS
jgi:hypothetical protein